ncbi:MAG: VWA domain-containing protein [Deltaproteobacteria bacterium]|nr:VWA domain-containing protein [Deltaproteobacteria bacterium]
MEILSPRDGARIVQEQDTVLVSGKVSTQGTRSPTLDITFVLDVSGSTANYAGVDLGDPGGSSSASGSTGWGRPRVGIFGGGIGMGMPPLRDLRSSILAAEVGATRRLLSQLNPESTRVGLIAFGEEARLLQPLTRDFELVRKALDEIVAAGPYGGTHMAGGIRLGIKELAGLGISERRANATKAQILLTDGFPTLPIGGGRRAAPEDTDLAIGAARIAAKAGIKIHVFALGTEALSYPRAAVGIAKESGGLYTPVVRPADILAVLDNISVVGVELVQVLNQTTGQRASHLRLAADGFYSSALPVVEGPNRIEVLSRASDGSVARESISVFYQRGGQRSLDLEIFLEKERNLKLEVERLGKSQEEIRREVERSRKDSMNQAGPPASSDEGGARQELR